MKIKYFSLFAIVSLLSVGTLTACANPCAGQSTSTTANQVTQNDPCAGKNPCAGANPCAGKNPCAGANPCAGKNPCAGANPCAGKNPCAGANPCAGKTKTIGASLAQELQGKPVVVDIYASWCAACKNIAPTLAQLEKDYAESVNFVVLNVSDQSTTTQAQTKAKKLGLAKFLKENKTQTGMLTIIDPATGEILAQHRNNPNIADYQTVLDKAISQ
ncbi:thioredoxin domain-containing protein [Cyanothece sp. BG0011]|uniref:TlpA family protein disulfide reductase n=1 Tax=Cyanothece sp. BG0011 TaxID=2082950 RepID=UPI000D1F7633|nr:thioredoxin domain-containing protein [Cyanothece sp. BG0011]